MRRFSNVVGFDDAPFDRRRGGNVPLVGAVFCDRRLDGVLLGTVRRDGANATRAIGELLVSSRFREHVRLVLLQGINFGGFNVVSIGELAALTGKPVLVVARVDPDLAAIRRALQRVAGGARKWRLVESAGAMERIGALFVQRAGLTLEEARWAIGRSSSAGHLPEPLRVAHLIAGALVRGQSRGGA